MFAPEVVPCNWIAVHPELDESFVNVLCSISVLDDGESASLKPAFTKILIKLLDICQSFTFHIDIAS
jgi:hypothetical protein